MPSRSLGPRTRAAPSRSSPRAASACSSGSASGATSIDVAVAGEQALDLLQADLAAADDEAAPARAASGRRCRTGCRACPCTQVWSQIPRAELADALLTGVGLCWHRPYDGRRPYIDRDDEHVLLHRRFDAAAGASARPSWRSPARARCSCRRRTPWRSRASSPTPARWTIPTHACGARRRSWTSSPGARATRPTRRPRRVRAIHAKVRGVLAEDAGPWPARDALRRRRPRAAAVDPRDAHGLRVARLRALRRRAEPAELDALWADYRVVGRLFGLADDEMPDDHAGFRDYMREMLAVGRPARDRRGARARDPTSCSARRCRPLRSRCASSSTSPRRLAAADAAPPVPLPLGPAARAQRCAGAPSR